LAGSEKELAELVSRLDETSSKFGMEICAEKTELMSNRDITSNITARGQNLETVSQFKYLGAIINDKESRAEILARTALTTAAMTKLNHIWKDKNISIKSKVRLLHALAMSIFLYACESWTS